MNFRLAAVLGCLPLLAQADFEGDDFGVQGQATNVWQWHPNFHSPYSGTNSLDAHTQDPETADITLTFGARLWEGVEFYADPEIDEGYGLSNTVGAAGFPSGEAYKVGKYRPYVRLPRIFVRKVFDLGGEPQKVDTDVHQLAGSNTADRITLTIGKYSVVDLFDTNSYAHDPRSDFLNWSVIDSGAFDYAADAWGFTYGATAEWTQSWWSLRAGYFDLSKVPNSATLDQHFHQYEWVGEGEARFEWRGRPGKIKVLVFDNRGDMGSYADALALAAQSGGVPNTGDVRRFASRPGIAANVEQEVAEDVGVFARINADQGNEEAFEFTDINRSLATGVSIKGNRWGRPSDDAGFAAVQNQISAQAQAYFAAGGIGVLVGDGRLNYAPEQIAEAFYNVKLYKHLTVGLDFQYIRNPAYNQDRGPVSVLGLRLHAEI